MPGLGKLTSMKCRKIERAIFVKHDTPMKNIASFDRVYYGAEFCEHLIPNVAEVRQVYEQILIRNKKMTFVTPYVTNKGLQSLGNIFTYLNRLDVNMEIVFNDWGVFRILQRQYSNLVPVLGRLLTKQKRDPLVQQVVFERQTPGKSYEINSKKMYLYYPRSVSSSIRNHFRGSLINVPLFQKFLLSNSVRRMEIDNLLWDMKVMCTKNIGISVYLPFGYVTTTRLCGLINLSYAKCKKECEKQSIVLHVKNTPSPLYVSGNTIFYKSRIPSLKYLRAHRIDRIILQSL